MIDAESIKTITEVTADTAEKLGADDATIDVIEQVGAVGEVLVSDGESDAPEG